MKINKSGILIDALFLTCLVMLIALFFLGIGIDLHSML